MANTAQRPDSRLTEDGQDLNPPGDVRRARRVASETTPERPASSADDVPSNTPQDRERAPELGATARSISHVSFCTILRYSPSVLDLFS